MAKLRRVALILITLLCTVGLAACSTSKKQTQQQTHPKQIKVVASTNIYGQMAQSVVGKNGQVKSLVNSGVDPHDFNPSTQDANQISDANIIIQNGIGYDDWMNKLDQNASDAAVKLNVGKLMNKKDGDNEHLWYDPQTAPKVVNQLVKEASKLQPNHKQEFTKNGQTYLNRLQKVNQLAATSRQNLKEHQLNRKVDVSEPVFDYALQAMGYEVNNRSFENATQKEVDPSPASIKAMKKDITDHRIAFFVDNTQTDSKTVSQMVKLAKQHDVPVVKVTETIPKNQKYVEWITQTYQEVLNVQQRELQDK
ncbi:metal ABC transporter solute-binding protein, Zn/Mn family [Fructilactobacillus cliffordii]|uniref:Zinc ABC transporter substrate-binding protein n=1 Tax=Fructilactobacillus cliffordii TaxID=2940299 RepID=A0A9Q9E301_9LACO|nr:zinc ABC transporter substrate-binding protein [Fructilactobacillus cliffordii]USS89272.1 zinc ABC transporter substrate-binding protein [Fructilactobacillus cliffordii]